MESLNDLLINIGNVFMWLFSTLWDYIGFSYTFHTELINQYEKYPYATLFLLVILFVIVFISSAYLISEYLSYLISEKKEYARRSIISFFILLFLLLPFLLPFELVRLLLNKRYFDTEKSINKSSKKDVNTFIVKDGFYIKKSSKE